jgi:hypothetical protein
MNIKLSTMLALILVGIFPAASLYAWQAGNTGEAPEGTEIVRQNAVEYILVVHGELKGLTAPTSWEQRNLTPEGLLGYNTEQYTGEGWIVTTGNAVVLRPTYSVEVEYRGEISFQWSGTVDQDGNVAENSFTIVK